MLTVLINAYACSPDMGSEPGMAWNWCVNLARYCELHIITEGEFRDKIEAALPELPQGKNMLFYYNPVSEEIRKMCWNQGDWRFYKYYRRWQWKTYEIAKDICRHERIDVLHQLNMIGFREPGYLWKLSDESGLPFVWGPVGGLKQFPVAYLKGAGLKMNLFNRAKNLINIVQLKYSRRVDMALKRADILISSIPDSYRMIKRYKHLESVVIPETGCFLNRKQAASEFQHEDRKSLRLLWVGKFDFRKQLGLAIKTIRALSNLDVELVVCGTGTDEQVSYYRQLKQELSVGDKIQWRGKLDNSDVMKEMLRSDLFFFTSVSEDTSTVVLEAVSNCLPVLCFDACGFGYVINDKVGIKVPLSNPEQSVKDFAEKIEFLYNHREVLRELAENCKQRRVELSWDSKARRMLELYNQCLIKE